MEWEAHMVCPNYLTPDADIMNEAQMNNANSTTMTMCNHSAAMTTHSRDDDNKLGTNVGESSLMRAIRI